MSPAFLIISPKLMPSAFSFSDASTLSTFRPSVASLPLPSIKVPCSCAVSTVGSSELPVFSVSEGFSAPSVILSSALSPSVSSVLSPAAFSSPCVPPRPVYSSCPLRYCSAYPGVASTVIQPIPSIYTSIHACA